MTFSFFKIDWWSILTSSPSPTDGLRTSPTAGLRKSPKAGLCARCARSLAHALDVRLHADVGDVEEPVQAGVDEVPVRVADFVPEPGARSEVVSGVGRVRPLDDDLVGSPQVRVGQQPQVALVRALLLPHGHAIGERHALGGPGRHELHLVGGAAVRGCQGDPGQDVFGLPLCGRARG